MPVGQWFTPTAHRKELVDFVHTGGNAVFWGVRRA